jgi:hypothetical protein
MNGNLINPEANIAMSFKTADRKPKTGTDSKILVPPGPL